MSILLLLLSIFITCFYIMSTVTGNFFEYIKGTLTKKECTLYKAVSYIEVVFIILMLIASDRGSQGMIFIFILLAWLLIWALFVPINDLLIEKRKGYLLLWVSVAIYTIITIINVNSFCLWIKMI